MINQVNNIIYNTLAEGREVYMPEVGTLLVIRKSAQRISSKKIIPPYVVVSYTGEQRGETLVSMIASNAGVDEGRANEIYYQWLSQARQGDSVVINGVGTIKEKKFMADKQFGEALNPGGIEPQTVKPQKNSDWWLYVLVALVVAVVLAGVLYVAGVFDKEPEVLPPAPQPVVEEVVAPEPTLPEGVVEMTAGNSYAVFGVYNMLENARKDVIRAKKLKGDLVPVIFEYDGRYMVALMDTPSRHKCVMYVESLRGHSDFFESVWVYTNKQ